MSETCGYAQLSQSLTQPPATQPATALLPRLPRPPSESAAVDAAVSAAAELSTVSSTSPPPQQPRAAKDHSAGGAHGVSIESDRAAPPQLQPLPMQPPAGAAAAVAATTSATAETVVGVAGALEERQVANGGPNEEPGGGVRGRGLVVRAEQLEEQLTCPITQVKH